MAHQQAVFLGHLVPMLVAFQVVMEIYVRQKKKAAQEGR
jgi:hypothetical protein